MSDNDMPEIITRKQAKKLGLKRYFTGKPCIKSHVSWRNIHTRNCSMCRRKPKKPFVSKNTWDRKKCLEYGKKYREKNREKLRKKNRIVSLLYAKNNPDKLRFHRRQRRARILNAKGNFTEQQVLVLLEKQKRKCVYCLQKITMANLNRDHIFPLSKGGTNWISNIQLTCKLCNLKKNAKDPVQFANECGKLL